MRLAAAILAATLAMPGAASASSSAWFETEGARIRLITTGLPDSEGTFLGALEIALQPGWKTYWRDPGDAGVPPAIDVSKSSNVNSAVLDFPPPERVDDGASKWAGYKHPVTFPVTFGSHPVSAAATIVTADIFLGVCESICVPVQARLELDPFADPDNADDAVAVKAAFDALPARAEPDFGVTALPGTREQMVLAATFPGEDAELFLATPEGYVFATPERVEKDGKTVFTVAIAERPETKPEAGSVPYTLVTSAGAVAGELPLP